MAENSEQIGVYLVPEIISPRILQIKVMASRIPENFLGVAFHLKIKGTKWNLLSFHSGSAISQNEPLVLAAEKLPEGDAKEIIFGESLKNGAKIGGDNLELARFLLNVEEPVREIEFAETHLSVYKSGRQDLHNVVWKNFEEEPGSLLPASTISSEGLSADFQVAADLNSANALTGIYQLLGFAFAGALFLLVLWLMMQRKWLKRQ